MGKIVCPTRGGEPSRRLQERAIELARQRGDELIFLYVVNTEFVRDLAAPILVDIRDELTKMGQFILLQAQERAAAQGVKARGEIREGPVRQAIQDFVCEMKADLLVIGRPRPESARRAFEANGIRDFARTLKEATGVEVEVV